MTKARSSQGSVRLCYVDALWRAAGVAHVRRCPTAISPLAPSKSKQCQARSRSGHKKTQGEPADPKAKRSAHPAKINKHKLAGQNEASAPSRLRGNYDISSIAVLVQHSSTHLPTGFREAWSSTTPTHASFYLRTDPEQPAMMLVVQPCARRNNPAVCRVHCALFGHTRPSYKPRSSTHLPTCFREAWSSTTPPMLRSTCALTRSSLQ